MIHKPISISALKNIKAEQFFLVVGITLGVILNFIVPPLQIPDDLNHFYRTFQISEGHFSPEQKDKRLGGEMPLCFAEFIEPFEVASSNGYYRVKPKDILHAFEIKLELNDRNFKDFPNTSYYAPISYLPQTVAVFLLSKSGASVGAIYYGGRMATFVFWLISMFFIIKMLPVYKWLFTLLILLPMNVYIANSFSADNITNILSFLFIALILKYSFGEKLVNAKVILFFLLIAACLAFAKIVYVALVFLLLLIPAKKFKSSAFRFAAIAGVIMIAFSLGYVWSNVVMKYYVSYQTYNPIYKEFGTLSKGADYHLQKAYSIAHPDYFFKVLFHTLTDNPHYFLTSYVGGFGTFLHLFMDSGVSSMVYLVIILVAIFENGRLIFTLRQKLLLLSTFCVTLFLLLLSQHLTWNSVGGPTIDCFQGRYLTPILPLMFILFNTRFKIKIQTSFFVMPFVLLLSAFACWMMFKGFVKELEGTETTFFCDAENLTADGKFKTSRADINLGGNRSEENARSGKYAIVLPPENPYALTFYFKGFEKGDLIEVEAWEKGEGGQLIVAGKGDICGDYYCPNNKMVYKDKNGWYKMRMVFSLWPDCKNSNSGFYLYNSGESTVYFDDVRFRWKKFKAKQ